MKINQFLFIGLIGVALSSVSYASFSGAIQQYWRTTSCATEEIKQGGELECYTNGTGTPILVGEAAQSGTVCDVSFSHTSQRFFCQNGIWHDYRDVYVHRRKRFIWLAIAAAVVAVTIVVAMVVGSMASILIKSLSELEGTSTNQNNPPTITCPDVEPVYYPPPRKTSVVVSWSFPTAYDDEDKDSLTPKLVSGFPSGYSFEKSTPPSYYRVTDKHGATDTCYIKINVVVNRCETNFPSHPLNGYMTCTPYQNDPVLGTTCTFTCKEGYQLSNSSSSLRTCQENGLFDGEEANCSKIECADLGDPDNGEKHCTNEAFYNSVCSSICYDDGYDSDGNFTRCQSDGHWTAPLPSCQDYRAPHFTFCPVSPVRVYADKGKTSATVRWESPTATDNSGNVTIIKTLGQEPGGTFDVGTHLISYMVRDPSGNDSPESCKFDVVVEHLQCDSPDGKFDDDLILADCPGTVYTYGTNCNVSCIRNYEIIGNTTITCERESPESTKMIWDWGGGSQPTCDNECPPLQPPANGAFVCQTAGNQYCRLSCNVEFGYPSGSKNQIFLCTDQQVWDPPEADDCTERSPPDANLIGADLHYFVGDCNDASVQENLKDKFLAYMVELVELVENEWSDMCPTDTGCIRDTIGVTCGPVTTRRKRETMGQYTGRWRPSVQNTDFSNRVKRTVSHVLTLTFTIEKPWVGGTTADDLQRNDQDLYDIIAAIENEIANGGDNISYNGISPADITADIWPMMECPIGQTPFYDGDIPNCEGCATGKYYEATISDCAKCPVGTYQDESHQTTCKACPVDMSTKETGRKNISECFPMCPAGSYSASGVIPCTECNVGEYQPKENSKSCHKCDVGKTTIGRGQISDSTCTSYDVVLSSPGYDIPFPNLTTTQEAVTLMFWLKCPLGNSTRPTFGFVNGDTITEILRAVDGETLKLLNKTMVEVTTNGWKHIAVVLSNTSKQAELMINGNSVWNATVDMENIAVSGSYLVMGQLHGNNSNCRISGLKMTNTSKSAADLQIDITTCTPNVDDAIYTMDNFKDKKGIEIDTPSKYDEVDECDSSPCGVHFCENLLNGYRCECKGGYTGGNCDVAPDYCVNHQCENGATCVTGEWNYTCTCSVGFKGTLCEDNIVDGNWAEWGIYTECSQTCNRGTKTRIRTCTNPSPGPDGADCSGNSQDQAVCNTEPCQECDPIGLLLLQSRHTKMDVCYYEGDYTRCNITCETGMDFVNAPRDFYECGANTSYQWNGIPPSCAASIPGRRLTIRTSVTYPSLLSCGTETDLALASAAGEAQCVRNNACTTSVSTTGCSSRRSKRDTDTTAEISFFISLEDLQDFNLTALLEHNIVSADLQTYINAIAELEQTAQEINNSASDFFAININNVTYNIDPETFSISGVITCPNGSIPMDGACVECPVGTSEDNGWCVFCDIGTYQDQEGQTECLTCPTGYTTQFVGMVDVANCSETLSTSTTEDVTTSTSTTEDTTTTNGNAHPSSIGTGTSVEVETTTATTKNSNSKKSEESALTVLTIALSLMAVSVITLTVVVIVYFKMRRYIRKRVASSESLRRQGSSVSINMIHPTFNTKVEGCVPFPDYSPMPNHHHLQTKTQMAMIESNHKTMHITKHI